MTIKEAEHQFNIEVSNCIKEHEKQIQKAFCIWIIVSYILIILGIVLTIIGFTTSSESVAAVFEEVYGISSLCIGILIFLTVLLSFPRLQKKGPTNFLPQIKNLYFNYIKCEDISKDDKEFYIQKLEDIRNMELINAINKASLTASSAIMFSTLHK